MNKELEEAIRVIKENQKDREKILKNNTFDKYIIESAQLDYDRNQAILDYIDNSISKEVIEKKIEELENSQKRVKNNKLIYSREDVFRFQIYILEELLEGK